VPVPAPFFLGSGAVRFPAADPSLLTVSFCAIDFGTSNSALAYPQAGRLVLAELEPGFSTMPTAVFYSAGEATRHYGRAAVAAYVDGLDGRLMRSLKSILGSDLMEETTEIAPGRSVRYRDVVIGYLQRMREVAQRQRGSPLSRAVLGRPVYFVDDDPVRDARAQETLAQAAGAAGFETIEFEFEPIAAARDFESRALSETLVLVADIGGGTSDFSLVRVGPRRRHGADRRGDILANHGVHIAGTDFDRAVNLATILPIAGYRSKTPEGREVPSSIYFDLATWHLINTTYAPARASEVRRMRPMYADGRMHARLLGILRHRLGHQLAARAEQAKIDVAEHGSARIDLDAVETRLAATLDTARQQAALGATFERIVAAARETLRRAQLTDERVQALYFTGGSTGLQALAARIAAQFPQAEAVHGNRFTSVVSGLALAAQRRFG
jgi:hypothetical chaperone protein